MGVEYAVNFQVGRAVVGWVLVMAQTVLKMLPTPLFAVVRGWRRGSSLVIGY
jgi:hypothetical protein